MIKLINIKCNSLLLFFHVMIIRFYRDKIYWGSLISAFVLILAILLPSYLISLKNKNDTIDNLFDTTSRLIQHDVTTNFENLVNNLDDISKGFGMIKSYNDIDEQLFYHLISNINNTNNFAVSYAPLVLDENRSQFESLLSNIYNNTIEIKVLVQPLEFNVSSVREFHFPIMFSNAATHVYGIDLAQSQNRKDEINASLITKQPQFANVIQAQTEEEHTLVNVIPMMYPVIDIDDNIISFLAIAFRIENYFKSTTFTYNNLDYAVLMDDNLLFSTNDIDMIQSIYDNELINHLKFTIFNKIFKIVVYGDNDFKESVTTNDNNIALIIGVILFISIILLITILFYLNEKSNKLLETTTRQSISKTYDRIVSYFSHEMRTPLNTIHSLIYYLNINDNDDNISDSVSFKDEYVLTASEMGTLYESVHRIKHFVDEMLSYQKMADGQMHISIQKYNIIEFCINILSNQSINCPNSIKMQLLVSKDLDEHPDIYIDTMHLSQIILNGLSNAIKFTNTGHIILRLYLKNIDKSSYLSLEILNTGIGLENIDLDTLFIPFSQGITKHMQFKGKNEPEKYTIFNYKIDKLTKLNVQKIMNVNESCDVVKYETYGKADETSAFNKQNGSGMGMPISKMLSISMGGDLTIKDEFDNGEFKWTNFHSVIDVSEPGYHINLPIQDSVIDLNEMTENQRVYSNKFNGFNVENINNKDIKVLLVDDTPGNLEMGQKIFSKLGYNIDTLTDGIFIDYDKVFEYDIILLDIIMAQSTGLDICSKLIKYKYDGIILATTGYVSDSDIINYHNHGFNGVYAKPFKISKTDIFFKSILIDKKWNVLK